VLTDDEQPTTTDHQTTTASASQHDTTKYHSHSSTIAGVDRPCSTPLILAGRSFEG